MPPFQSRNENLPRHPAAEGREEAGLFQHLRQDEYVAFSDGQGPHRGIQQQIPKPGEPDKTGGVVRESAVLGGLHHHCCRQAA